MNQQNSFGMRRFSLFPPVLKTILIINLVVFLIDTFMLSAFHIGGVPLSRYFMHYFALHPFYDGSAFISANNFYPWQFISYQFMHAGFWHIFFNLFVLWMFGSELEDLWGPGKFLTFYLLAGMGAGLIHLFITPMIGGGMGPTVGASGAVYGVLMAFGLTYPQRPIYMFPFFIPIKAIYFVILLMGIELVFGFSSNDNIARFAHLGGAAMGFLLLKFGDRFKIYRPAEKLFRKSPAKNSFGYDNQSASSSGPTIHKFSWGSREPEQKVYTPEPQKSKIALNLNGEEITQARIDEILDKISAGGYQSLTEKEKYILVELSKKL